MCKSQFRICPLRNDEPHTLISCRDSLLAPAAVFNIGATVGCWTTQRAHGCLQWPRCVFSARQGQKTLIFCAKVATMRLALNSVCRRVVLHPRLVAAT